MKLKTLYELNLREEFTLLQWKEIRMSYIRIEEKIRKEAIKWIKKLRTEKGFEEITGIEVGDVLTPERMSEGFQKFMNISEEKLS